MIKELIRDLVKICKTDVSCKTGFYNKRRIVLTFASFSDLSDRESFGWLLSWKLFELEIT